MPQESNKFAIVFILIVLSLFGSISIYTYQSVKNAETVTNPKNNDITNTSSTLKTDEGSQRQSSFKVPVVSKETIASQKATKAPIIEVDLRYDLYAERKLSIQSIKQKIGFAPQTEPGEAIGLNTEYKLDVVDGAGNVLQTIPIYFTERLYDDLGHLLNQEEKNTSQRLEALDFTVFSPLDLNSTAVVLKTRSGSEIQKMIIDTSNLKAQALAADAPLAAASAVDSGADQLDVAIVGDDFSQQQMGVFRDYANRIKNGLLSNEPYKSNSSKFRFQIIENVADLGCVHHGKAERLILCDNNKVFGVIKNSGKPYDTIIVLLNNKEWGGAVVYSGNVGIAAVPTNDSIEFIIRHEFGHSFGFLYDEYAYEGESANGKIDNKLHNNCLAGSPPSQEWASLGVGPDDYRTKCGTYFNWYSSSPTSIMSTSKASSYNTVSKKILEKRLGFYSSGSAPEQAKPQQQNDTAKPQNDQKPQQEKPQETTCPYSNLTLKNGSEGDPVRDLQIRLKNRGYNLGNFGPNQDGIDGIFKDVTEAAVRAFQTDQKKTNPDFLVDGIVGPQTWGALCK